MSTTRTLASYISKLKYEDLPPAVAEKGRLAVMDGVGNAIGGYGVDLSRTFLALAKETGGGKGDATLIGDGSRVSVSMGAFGNGALATMLDFCDDRGMGRLAAWLGAMAVPAALASGESRGISGKELITSVVAGYECGARLLDSMDVSFEQGEKVWGETLSVFAAAGAAGRALGLGEDEMLSALGMAGIYTPVPGARKWMGDPGLRPMKDIKQGWGWMCMTGTFAAVSAQKGLKMLQPNNILDGDKGLWRMLAMDSFKEELLTSGLGQKYYIEDFSSKLHPGCTTTHPAIIAVEGLTKEHNIAVSDIERIEVITNESESIGMEDQAPVSLADREFSTPYQVAAALVAGEPGPNWYTESTARSPEMADMIKRVTLSFDEECERAYREEGLFTTKVTVLTKAGQRHNQRVDMPRLEDQAGGLKNKFLTTASQVTDRGQAQKILSTLDNLESVGKVSELTEQLRFSG